MCVENVSIACTKWKSESCDTLPSVDAAEPRGTMYALSGACTCTCAYAFAHAYAARYGLRGDRACLFMRQDQSQKMVHIS